MQTWFSSHLYSTDWHALQKYTCSQRISFQQVKWPLQPLCSHPIKSCQIDFDNNFQLRLHMKLLLEVTHVRHSVRASLCACVRLRTQAPALHSGHASAVILCLISFRVQRKEPH